MKKVLLTCFEPFGKNAVNTSEKAVSLVRPPDGYEIKKVLLPVVWWKSADLIFNAIESYQPDIIVMCGLASGSDAVRVETQGVNICGKIRDNDGEYACEQGECEIVPGGEKRLYSTFDCTAILKSVEDLRVPVRASESAGTYICNHILYSVLNRTKEQKIKAGFIHVPDAREYGGVIPLENLRLAIETAIQSAWE